MAQSLPYVPLDELRRVRDLLDRGENRFAILDALDARIRHFEEMHAEIDRESAAEPAPGQEFTAAAHQGGAVKTAERPPTLELVK